MTNGGSSRAVGAPHVASNGSVGRVMRLVIYALLPGCALHLYFFGWGVAVNVVIATAAALLFEAAMLAARRQPLKRFLADGSAVLTAILLALSLPPLLPWWVPVLGSFVAIVVAKQLYGGLGFNPFNPAMAAFAVLLIAFPREMSLWSMPVELQSRALDFAETWGFSLDGRLPDALAFDALTAATPLDRMRTEHALGATTAAIRQGEVFGHWAGRGSEWVSVAYLLGGLLLIGLRVISWHIPAALLATLAAAAWLGMLFDPDYATGPALHLLGGATMLGAFFIATDPVTAATTPLGKLLYGAGIGILIYAIRTWGSYPDAVAFAVMLMGLAVPLLDRYALPRVFGAGKRDDRAF